MPPILARLLAIPGAALGTPWLAWQERRLLSKGHPLPQHLRTWAASQGIQNIEKIRTLHTHPLPLPAPMCIRRWLHSRNFPCLHLAGLSIRHGIYLAPDLPNPHAILQHELIHTRQYQEAGSLFAFLNRYLFQCLTQGYHHCQMERQARGEI